MLREAEINFVKKTFFKRAAYGLIDIDKSENKCKKREKIFSITEEIFLIARRKIVCGKGKMLMHVE